MKHTKEPWKINRRHITTPLIEPFSIGLAYCRSVGEDEALANGARIVQCVNDCAGVPDPKKAFELLKEIGDDLDSEQLKTGDYPFMADRIWEIFKDNKS